MMRVCDLMQHCLQADKDSEFYITDNKNEELYSGPINEMPVYLVTEYVRSFFIKSFFKDNYMNVIEITLEYPESEINLNVADWMRQPIKDFEEQILEALKEWESFDQED